MLKNGIPAASVLRKMYEMMLNSPSKESLISIHNFEDGFGTDYSEF